MKMYYFVSENIFAYNSGTEHAQAKRVQFFNREHQQNRLGQAAYVTRDYNRFLNRDATAVGLNNDEVVNMYDYFQGTTNVPRKKQHSRLLPQLPLDRYHIVGHGPNYSTVEDKGRVIARINVMPATVGLVNDITYYDRADNITVRENFDWRGFKSSVDYFHQDGQLAVQQFLNLAGDPVIEITHMNINGQLLPSMYKLKNYLGHDYRFNSQEQLFLFFLNEITRQQADITLISDRRGLDHVVAAVQGTVHKYAYLHGIHVGNVKHPVRGKLYDAYTNVLERYGQAFTAILVSTSDQQKDLKSRYPELTIKVAPDISLSSVVLNKAPITLQTRQLHQLIVVGRLSPEKRPEQALRVLAKVIKTIPDATLVYYGYAASQEVMDDLQTLAQKLAVTDHVTFGGYVSEEKLQQAYQQAQIILQPSIAESFGMNLVEAMSYGTPAISYDVPYGAQALIDDGHNGYIVPEGSSNAMAQKAIDLLSDDNLWSQMSAAAYVKSHNFADDKTTKLWQNIFK